MNKILPIFFLLAMPFAWGTDTQTDLYLEPVYVCDGPSFIFAGLDSGRIKIYDTLSGSFTYRAIGDQVHGYTIVSYDPKQKTLEIRRSDDQSLITMSLDSTPTLPWIHFTSADDSISFRVKLLSPFIFQDHTYSVVKFLPSVSATIKDTKSGEVFTIIPRKKTEQGAAANP